MLARGLTGRAWRRRSAQSEERRASRLAEAIFAVSLLFGQSSFLRFLLRGSFGPPTTARRRGFLSCTSSAASCTSSNRPPAHACCLPPPPPFTRLPLTPPPLPRGACADPTKPGTASSSPSSAAANTPAAPATPAASPLTLAMGLRFVNTPSWPLATPKYFTLYPLGSWLPPPPPPPSAPTPARCPYPGAEPRRPPGGWGKVFFFHDFFAIFLGGGGCVSHHRWIDCCQLHALLPSI